MFDANDGAWQAPGHRCAGIKESKNARDTSAGESLQKVLLMWGKRESLQIDKGPEGPWVNVRGLVSAPQGTASRR